jgi:hypothetical protein
LRVFLQYSPMFLDVGNGLFAVYFARYILSMCAVCCLSLNERELCPLQPCAESIPCCWSMSFRCVVTSSWASNPVSARIVKMVAYFVFDAEMILLMFSVVGISGIFRSVLYVGFVHWILLVLQNQLYAKQSLVLVALLIFAFAM